MQLTSILAKSYEISLIQMEILVYYMVCGN